MPAKLLALDGAHISPCPSFISGSFVEGAGHASRLAVADANKKTIGTGMHYVTLDGLYHKKQYRLYTT